MTIELLTPAHWPQVQTIYRQGIATGYATFQTEAPTWDEWDRSHLQHSRLVAIDNVGQVLGWVALMPVSSRSVYAGVAEESVYVATHARGQGVGQQLLAALITSSEAHSIWMLQASIFPENLASVRLHEVVGFRIVGRRERIGCLAGTWHDTLLLERRSHLVGMA